MVPSWQQSTAPMTIPRDPQPHQVPPKPLWSQGVGPSIGPIAQLLNPGLTSEHSRLCGVSCEAVEGMSAKSALIPSQTLSTAPAVGLRLVFVLMEQRCIIPDSRYTIISQICQKKLNLQFFSHSGFGICRPGTVFNPLHFL